jgi:hypothetical protein
MGIYVLVWEEDNTGAGWVKPVQAIASWEFDLSIINTSSPHTPFKVSASLPWHTPTNVGIYSEGRLRTKIYEKISFQIFPLWTFHLYVATFQQHPHVKYISLSCYEPVLVIGFSLI